MIEEIQRHMPSVNVFTDGDPASVPAGLAEEAALLVVGLVRADEPICLYERFDQAPPGGCVQYDLVYHADHTTSWHALETAIAAFRTRHIKHAVLFPPQPVHSLGLGIETLQVRVNLYSLSPAGPV